MADVRPPTRRVLLTGVAAVGAGGLIAACGSSGGSGAAGSASRRPSPLTSGETESASPNGERTGKSTRTTDGGAAAVPTKDVPVGGGVVLKAQKVVVTQPTAGSFKAFSAVCTHQGCIVARVADKQIQCDCHGSRYSIADGSVEQGPATQPLPTQSASVQGGGVVLG